MEPGATGATRADARNLSHSTAIREPPACINGADCKNAANCCSVRSAAGGVAGSAVTRSLQVEHPVHLRSAG